MTDTDEAPLRVGVVIAAGGSGRRMGSSLRKQYLRLAGEPVLLRALRPFLNHPAVEAVVVALPPEDVVDPPEWLASDDPRLRIVAGGGTREASVRAALEELPEALDVIAIHDGARPLVTAAIIDRCFAVAARGEGAVAGCPAVDTIKVVDGRRVVETPDRATLWHAQTPQVFPRGMLLEAYRRADSEGGPEPERKAATDDAALVARFGWRVMMVEGSRRNIKVTRPEDMKVAEALLDGLEDESP